MLLYFCYLHFRRTVAVVFVLEMEVVDVVAVVVVAIVVLVVKPRSRK